MKAVTRKLTIAALAFVLSATAGLAQAGPPMHRHARGGFGDLMFAFFGHQLGLSDAQKAQIKDIMTKERPTLQPLLAQLAQGQSQLHQLEMGTFDEAQARTIATQQSQTMTELAVQRAKIEAELIQVLTPDQKTSLAEMWQRREHRRASHSQNAPAQQ
jgi:Spy/CpxP family protein refolding chaperone